MLMMLASWALWWGKDLAVHAHDARRLASRRAGKQRLMLMMLASWAADAHDAGLLGLWWGEDLAVHAYDAGLLGLWWGKGLAVHAHDAGRPASRGAGKKAADAQEALDGPRAWQVIRMMLVSMISRGRAKGT